VIGERQLRAGSNVLNNMQMTSEDEKIFHFASWILSWIAGTEHLLLILHYWIQIVTMALTSVSTVVVALLAYLLYHFVIYPAFISPLSKIPSAHPTSSVVPTWIWWKRRRGQECSSIFAAHQLRGPVVRLSPNEVSVVSQDGLRKIYVGGFERTNWFLQFQGYDGTPNLVTLFDGKAHATRKRMISHIYSKSYLLDSSDFQILAKSILFERFLPLLDNAAREEQGVDMLDLGYGVGAELMSAYIMGLENGYDLLSTGKEEERAKYLESARKKMRNMEGSEIATKELEAQCLEMCEKAGLMVAKEKADIANTVQKDVVSSRTFPVVYAQLSASILTGETATASLDPALVIASELLDSIEASREGVGITIVYAMHELSMRLALQSELHKELMTLETPMRTQGHAPLSTPMLRQLESLPLLDAIITETLRLHHPSPGPQRRMVPKDGASIDGYFIPEGVTISSSAYSLHRYQTAFPEANTWIPERWMRMRSPKDEQSVGLEASSLGVDDPRRWFFAWGRGGRMCIGSNFASLVLKLLLASIYTNYTTSILEDDGMEHRDEMMASPVGDKLILRFNRVS
jgi:hypothetical protein